MMLFGKKPEWKFTEEKLIESTEYLGNPGCGWYHIHAFSLEEEPDMEELYWCLCKEETLALVMLDIGAYREEPLPESVLGRMRGILDFFGKQGKELIVRAVYDKEGRGMEREPASIQTVEAHMQQIGAVLSGFAEQIVVVQGLLVGNWGEMHGSKFLSKEKLQRLFLTYRSALGNIRMAVRTPVQWRMIHTEGTKPEQIQTGLFDDGMFGSSSNLGTYGTRPKESAGWEKEWRREDELDFAGYLGERIPYGGEAVGTDICGELPQALAELKRTHVSYLNSVYDEQILGRWKQTKWQETGVWNGRSGYDYIGARLGYRFVIRDIYCRCGGKYRKTPCIEVRIENAGFAPLYEEAELTAVWETDGEEKEERLPTDMRLVLPDRQITITILLPENTGKEERRLYLILRRKRDGRILRFANQTQGDRVYLGLLGNR